MDEEQRRLSKLSKRSGGLPLIPISQEDIDLLNAIVDDVDRTSNLNKFCELLHRLEEDFKQAKVD